MKIGDAASYTFIDKRIFVAKWGIYEKTQAYTVKGIIIAKDSEFAYLKTKCGTIKKLQCLIQIEKPQS